MATSSESAAAAHSAVQNLLDKADSSAGTQNSVRTGDRVKDLLHNFSSHFAGVKQDPNDKSLPIRYFRDTKGVQQVQLTKSAYDFYKNDLGIEPTYTFGEKDTTLIQEMKDAQLAADFDTFFLNKFKNTKDPGKKALMEKIYPEIIKKKEEQLLTDIELEVRLKMLKEFGPQSLDDYVVEYLKEKEMMDTLDDNTGAIVRAAGAPQYAGVTNPEIATRYGWGEDQYGNPQRQGPYSTYVPGILFRLLQQNPLYTLQGADFNDGSYKYIPDNRQYYQALQDLCNFYAYPMNACPKELRAAAARCLYNSQVAQTPVVDAVQQFTTQYPFFNDVQVWYRTAGAAGGGGGGGAPPPPPPPPPPRPPGGGQGNPAGGLGNPVGGQGNPAGGQGNPPFSPYNPIAAFAAMSPQAAAAAQARANRRGYAL